MSSLWTLTLTSKRNNMKKAKEILLQALLWLLAVTLLIMCLIAERLGGKIQRFVFGTALRIIQHLERKGIIDEPNTAGQQRKTIHNTQL